jgi:uncharacterized protein YecE (DUF72 family)
VWFLSYNAKSIDMAKLYCGTSGYAYDTWKPGFYPDKLPSKKYLAHYATRLNAVEINYTYHRLPSPGTLQGWLTDTPAEFLLCLKAHMRITHMQRLKKSEFNEVFFRAIDPLRVAGRLGPVLFQLPPNLQSDVALLREFLEEVPADLRCVFEFRHKSWFQDDVYAVLEGRNAAMCLAESEKIVAPPRITADFVYFRLRKPEYSLDDRGAIAEKVREQLEAGRDTHVFFKHEDTPEGAMHAEGLLRSTT